MKKQAITLLLASSMLTALAAPAAAFEFPEGITLAAPTNVSVINMSDGSNTRLEVSFDKDAVLQSLLELAEPYDVWGDNSFYEFYDHATQTGGNISFCAQIDWSLDSAEDWKYTADWDQGKGTGGKDPSRTPDWEYINVPLSSDTTSSAIIFDLSDYYDEPAWWGKDSAQWKNLLPEGTVADKTTAWGDTSAFIDWTQHELNIRVRYYVCLTSFDQTDPAYRAISPWSETVTYKGEANTKPYVQPTDLGKLTFTPLLSVNSETGEQVFSAEFAINNEIPDMAATAAAYGDSIHLVVETNVNDEGWTEQLNKDIRSFGDFLSYNPASDLQNAVNIIMGTTETFDQEKHGTIELYNRRVASKFTEQYMQIRVRLQYIDNDGVSFWSEGETKILNAPDPNAKPVEAKSLPTAIDAPVNLKAYDISSGKNIRVMATAEKPAAFDALLEEIESTDPAAYGAEEVAAYLQLDWSIDAADDWKYDPSWDTLSPAGKNPGDIYNKYDTPAWEYYDLGVLDTTPAENSMLILCADDTYSSILDALDGIYETVEGKYSWSQAPFIDWNKHTLNIRARYVIKVVPENPEQWYDASYIISPWSEAATLSKGAAYTIPAEIEAPLIDEVSNGIAEWNGQPYTKFVVTPTAQTRYLAMLADANGGDLDTIIELKVKDGEWISLTYEYELEEPNSFTGKYVNYENEFYFGYVYNYSPYSFVSDFQPGDPYQLRVRFCYTAPDGTVIYSPYTDAAEKEAAPELPASPAFADVAADAYYAAPVAWAVDKKITNGTSDTTFSPDVTCTRAQILTFLWRAAGSPESTAKMTFTDVAEGEYYYKPVLWAIEKGIVDAGTAFEPNAACTRSETVRYMWRYAGAPASETVPAFTDVAADTEEYKAVAWALDAGVTTGTSDTTFSPEATCLRGQIVTFLCRAFAE